LNANDLGSATKEDKATTINQFDRPWHYAPSKLNVPLDNTPNLALAEGRQSRVHYALKRDVHTFYQLINCLHKSKVIK